MRHSTQIISAPVIGKKQDEVLTKSEQLLIESEEIIDGLIQQIRPPDNDQEDIRQACYLAILESHETCRAKQAKTRKRWITDICLEAIQNMYHVGIDHGDSQKSSLETLSIVDKLIKEASYNIIVDDSSPLQYLLDEEYKKIVREILESDLTDRQREIALLLLSHESPTPASISRILRLSPQTIEKHIAEIRKRCEELLPKNYRAKEMQDRQHEVLIQLWETYGVFFRVGTTNAFLVNERRIKEADLAIREAIARYPNVAEFEISLSATGNIKIEPKGKDEVSISMRWG